MNSSDKTLDDLVLVPIDDLRLTKALLIGLYEIGALDDIEVEDEPGTVRFPAPIVVLQLIGRIGQWIGETDEWVEEELAAYFGGEEIA